MIFFFTHWFTPLTAAVFSGYFHSQMGKPAVRRSAVPVLYTGHNVDHIAGVQLLRLLTPFLIVAAPGHADKDLSAAFVRLVDVPVVTAAGFKGHIEDFDLLRGDRRKIALPAEILCETVIGRSDGKCHTVLMTLLFVGAFLVCPDVLCHAECCPFTDFNAIDKEVAEITSEIDVLSGLVQKLVDENASTTLDQTEYRSRYDGYIDRYDKAKKRLAALQEQRQLQELKGDILSGFLFELGELYDLPMVFKDETWNALVDHVTVHKGGRVVFTFKNGTEVTEML